MLARDPPGVTGSLSSLKLKPFVAMKLSRCLWLGLTAMVFTFLPRARAHPGAGYALSFANRAGRLARALAHRAFDFRFAAANLAPADVHGLAALHFNHIPIVILVPGRISLAAFQIKLLPDVAVRMFVHMHVFPNAS